MHEKINDIQDLSRILPKDVSNIKTEVLDIDLNVQEEHKCDICNKIFKKSDLLQWHLKFTHDKIKEYNKKKGLEKIQEFENANNTTKILHKDVSNIKTEFDIDLNDTEILDFFADPIDNIADNIKEEYEDGHENDQDDEDDDNDYLSIDEFVELNAEIHKCRFCEEFFAESDSLNEHIKYVHVNEQKKINDRTCQICGKEFSRIFDVKRHVISVHEGQKRNAYHRSCEICGKEFRYVS